jgi:hypothetical protein
MAAAMALALPAAAPISTSLIVSSPSASAVPVTALLVSAAVPSLRFRPPAVVSAIVATEIVSPTFAPTWKVCAVKLPSSSLTPLKLVCVATRSISAISCDTSCCIAARSDALLVAFTA